MLFSLKVIRRCINCRVISFFVHHMNFINLFDAITITRQRWSMRQHYNIITFGNLPLPIPLVWDEMQRKSPKRASHLEISKAVDDNDETEKNRNYRARSFVVFSFGVVKSWKVLNILIFTVIFSLGVDLSIPKKPLNRTRSTNQTTLNLKSYLNQPHCLILIFIYEKQFSPKTQPSGTLQCI